MPFTGWDLPELPSLPLPLPVPPPGVVLRTPLPDFNVADREDRWAYFETDTMPAYVRLLEEQDRAMMAAELARPWEDRIAEQRALRRAPAVLAQLGPGHCYPVIDP